MSCESNDQDANYIHGSSTMEQERLSSLNALLNDRCLRELSPKPGDRVLDVGCGLGQFSRVVGNAVGKSGYVLGIERNEKQHAQAGTLANRANEQGLVEFRLGDALALPLDDTQWGTFDIVHCRFLLEHLADPRRAVAEMIKAGRPGGRVFLADDDHGYFHPWPEPEGFQLLWQGYVRTYELLGNDPYVGRKLPHLLRDAGLESVSNSSVFFGGCAGNDTFGAVAGNLIRAINGAKSRMISGGLIDHDAFEAGMTGLSRWQTLPDATLWYSICCAGGEIPARV